MNFIHHILRLCVVILFSALGASVALAVPVATSESIYFQTYTKHAAQSEDDGFAARAPPFAAQNVAITGGVAVMQGSAFALNGQGDATCLKGFHNAQRIEAKEQFKGFLTSIPEFLPVIGDAIAMEACLANPSLINCGGFVVAIVPVVGDGLRVSLSKGDEVIDLTVTRASDGEFSYSGVATNTGLPTGSTKLNPAGAQINAPKDFDVYQTPAGDRVYKSPNGTVYKSLDEIPQVTAYNNKHVAPKNVPWNKVVEGTKSGPAKYANDVDINATTLKAWETGKSVTNGKDWKVFDTGQIVGAKSGQQTPYMRVERAPDGQLHGHPITLQEFSKLTK